MWAGLRFNKLFSCFGIRWSLFCHLHQHFTVLIIIFVHWTQLLEHRTRWREIQGLNLDLSDCKRVCYQLSYPCLCRDNKLWCSSCSPYQSLSRKKESGKRVSQSLRNNFERAFFTGLPNNFSLFLYSQF